MPQDYRDLYHTPQAPAAPQRSVPPQPPPPPSPGSPPPMYYGAGSPPPVPQRPAPPAKPFNPIPLLLIAGVAFLFLGGLIFLTGTWGALPSMARAVALLSASVVAFGANIIAERVLKLPKTGLAFYILGCIFLPMALGGIGAFALCGGWFSFRGEGCLLVWTLIFACVAATCCLGQNSYRSVFLAWCGLAGSAGAWTCFSVFLTDKLLTGLQDTTCSVLCGAMLLLFAVGMTVWGEWKMRRQAQRPFARAMVYYLYPLYVGYLIYMLLLTGDAPFLGGILLLLTTLLFLNQRFIEGNFHAGVFGFIIGMFGVLNCLCALRSIEDVQILPMLLMILSGTSLALMAFQPFRSLHPALRSTFSGAGMIVSVFPLFISTGYALARDLSGIFYAGTRAVGYLSAMYTLLFMALLFFLTTKHSPLKTDTAVCCITLALLFQTALTGVLDANEANRNCCSLLLVGGALLLLAQGLLCRSLWRMVLSVAACAAMLTLQTPQPLTVLFWLVAVGMLAGVVYAHAVRRTLLERCCAWCGIIFLLTALKYTVCESLPEEYRLNSMGGWMLLTAVTALLYLLEAVPLRRHARTAGTKLFLLFCGLGCGCFALQRYMDRTEYMDGSAELFAWGALLVVTLGIFAADLLRRRVNIGAFVPLLMCCIAADCMIQDIWLPQEWAQVLVRTLCFVIVLLLFAGLGRWMLPQFCRSGSGMFQLDVPLLMGVFPVLGAASTIDWDAEVLTCLFLSIYSLLYLGRIKNRRIPLLLCSCFACLALFFHNTNDPFGILAPLHATGMATLRILLLVLPVHLYLLSLLFILPVQWRPGVHLARFVMYCASMACLLIASLFSDIVGDAIVLVVCCFAILAGSFAVKRLRWFTLGFAVLVVMTVQLTWSFWTSLHWGVYLFLAGALLIGIAFVYELRQRRATQKTSVFRPFADWKW